MRDSSSNRSLREMRYMPFPDSLHLTPTKSAIEILILVLAPTRSSFPRVARETIEEPPLATEDIPMNKGTGVEMEREDQRVDGTRDLTMKTERFR